MNIRPLADTIYQGILSICTIKLATLAFTDVYGLFVASLVATATIGKTLYEIMLLREKIKRQRKNLPPVDEDGDT